MEETLSNLPDRRGACYHRLSRIISVVLHPFIIPTLAVVLLLFGPTFMAQLQLPIQVNLFLIGVVILYTLLLPLFSIGVLRWFKLIPDTALRTPRERILPMAVLIVCYGLCIVTLGDKSYAFLITRFLIAALCCLIVTFVINFYWKISLHMTAMGGMLGMIFVLCYTGLAHLQYGLILGLLLAGGLGSARLYLGSHNIGQVAAGTACGILIATGVILFL